MSSPSYEELKALVWLNRFGNPRKVLECLEAGLTLLEVMEKETGDRLKLQPVPCFNSCFNPEKEIEACEKRGIRLLTWFDADYPALLREIPGPPLLLYMTGNMEQTDEAAIAIVGTRHPSFYGTTQTKRFAKELAQSGVTIISGFAKGIDQTAHQAALEISWGRTIAVLGCGIDIDYPRGSRKLFDQIKERGAVISEYILGTDPRAENFPRRNRIISGLSLGTLVVEAHSISGSLITAHEAADQGREVFAIPGPVDQLGSLGVHRLIKEGAMLAESPLDILETLAPVLWPLVINSRDTACHAPTQQKGTGLSDSLSPFVEEAEAIPQEESESLSASERTLLNVLRNGPLAADEIAASSEWSPGELISSLTQMELRRKIHKTHDGKFALVIARTRSVRSNDQFIKLLAGHVEKRHNT